MLGATVSYNLITTGALPAFTTAAASCYVCLSPPVEEFKQYRIARDAYREKVALIT